MGLRTLRPMTKPVGRRAIESRLVDKTVNPEPDSWEPDLSRADLIDETACPLVGPHRIFQKLWFFRGQVIHFVLIQQVEAGDSWDDVVRIDCCHAEVHAHYYRAPDDEARRQVFSPITSQADVTKGLDWAESVVYEHWEENLRGWNG